jgi:hypothetical protein
VADGRLGELWVEVGTAPAIDYRAAMCRLISLGAVWTALMPPATISAPGNSNIAGPGAIVMPP